MLAKGTGVRRDGSVRSPGACCVSPPNRLPSAARVNRTFVTRFTPPLPACLYTDSSNQEQIRAERDWRTPVAFHQRRLKRVVPCIGCR